MMRVLDAGLESGVESVPSVRAFSEHRMQLRCFSQNPT